MKLAIMQPYFFPYIGYFQLINSVDKFVFYDDVNFIKKGWIHRNNLLINNESFLFTIPCKAVSQNKLINQILLNFDNKEKLKFLRRVQLAYKNAKYFDTFYYKLESFILNDNSTTISELAGESIIFISDYLKIKTSFLYSSKNFSETINSDRQQRLINISKAEKTTTYINAIGGKELYSKIDFNKNGIDLKFLKTGSVAYKQFANEFIPNLSIIDVLMFNSKEEVKTYLNQYTLVD